jgi:hypothetical protein
VHPKGSRCRAGGQGPYHRGGSAVGKRHLIGGRSTVGRAAAEGSVVFHVDGSSNETLFEKESKASLSGRWTIIAPRVDYNKSSEELQELI